MKTRSAKAKGRRAASEVAAALLACAPDLHPDDIRVTPSSVPGEDLMLSAAARTRFPFAIEVKNCERLNIWSALEQARRHLKDETSVPLLVFRRNHTDLHVALPFSDFLNLLKP